MIAVVEARFLRDLVTQLLGLKLLVIVQILLDDSVWDLLAPKLLADLNDAYPSVLLPQESLHGGGPHQLVQLCIHVAPATTAPEAKQSADRAEECALLLNWLPRRVFWLSVVEGG